MLIGGIYNRDNRMFRGKEVVVSGVLLLLLGVVFTVDS